MLHQMSGLGPCLTSIGLTMVDVVARTLCATKNTLSAEMTIKVGRACLVEDEILFSLQDSLQDFKTIDLEEDGFLSGFIELLIHRDLSQVQACRFQHGEDSVSFTSRNIVTLLYLFGTSYLSYSKFSTNFWRTF